MGIIETVGQYDHGRGGRTHSSQFRMSGRIALNALVGFLKTTSQQGLRIGRGRFGVGFLDDFNRNAARFLTAFVAAHAIGHYCQPALLSKFRIAGRLPIGIAVLIVLALATQIAEASHFNTRSNRHETSDYTLWAGVVVASTVYPTDG